MKLLLDTHIFLWWLEEHPRLSKEVLRLVGDSRNEVSVSAGSLWEISTKHRLGKLPLPCASVDELPQLVLGQHMDLLPIFPGHAVLAGSWTTAHRDPFDRVLAAQAKIENMILVTQDEAFKEFGITLLG